MHKVKLVLTSVAAGVFCLALAHAEGDAAPKAGAGAAKRGNMDAMFTEADANVDGMLSLDEFKVMDAKIQENRKARMGDKFDAAKEVKKPSAEDRFKKLDADANGLLTKEELMGGARQKDHPAGQKKQGAGKAAL